MREHELVRSLKAAPTNANLSHTFTFQYTCLIKTDITHDVSLIRRSMVCLQPAGNFQFRHPKLHHESKHAQYRCVHIVIAYLAEEDKIRVSLYSQCVGAYNITILTGLVHLLAG